MTKAREKTELKIIGPNQSCLKNAKFVKLEEWVHVRGDEALRIDAETAEVLWGYADMFDPYGLYSSSTMNDELGVVFFARKLGGNIWVSFDDLPEKTHKRLCERVKQVDFPIALEDVPNWLNR